jgi:Glyoxalase-like domain
MALKNILGIDHAVVVVKHLDRAAENWKRLGFTISPRGTHSAKMGSGNYTIMLETDYVELLGIVAETEQNTSIREFLASRGEGIERVAYTALDAAAGAEEIRLHGYTPIGPIEFERPVTLPNGHESKAKFSVFQWPVDEPTGGIRIFACQHKTPDKVWIAELQKHANTARSLEQVIIISSKPENDAKRLARLIDREVSAGQDGAFFVSSGSDRADVLFLTRELFGRRFPGSSMAELPERGAAALVFDTDDLVSAERAVGTAGARIEAGVIVPPAAANGVLLAFVTADDQWHHLFGGSR